MVQSDAYVRRQERESVSFELKRVSWQVDRQDGQVGDLRTARQSDSRIAMLRDQLDRSQSELESTSARFTEVAAAIPDEIGFLGDRLAAIFQAASAEADEIRSQAHRFAETVRLNAEQGAAGILAEAQLDYQLAAKMRDDAVAQGERALTDVARVKEQATLDAAETLAEARSHAEQIKSDAEEVLLAIQRQVDAQVAAGRTKLDELNQVRAKVVAQLKNFYDTFNALENPWIETDPVRAVSMTPLPADLHSVPGAHTSSDAGSAQRPLGDVG